MYCDVPEMISHDALLVALDVRPVAEERTVYELQLRTSLLALARKAHLEVAAHELTGMDPYELNLKSSEELMILLDRERGNLNAGDTQRLRYFW